MRKFNITLILTVIIFLTCVTTRFTSFTDPSYRSYKLKMVVVFAPGFDLDSRTTLENAIIKKFKDKNVYAFSSLKVFPPTRDYSFSEIQNKLAKSKCNSVLIVKIKGADTGFSTMWHQTLVTQNTLYTFPIGYQYRTSEFITEIYDKKIDNKIWMSESKTKAEGSFYTGKNTTLNNYASQMVEELAKCGHIQKY